MRLPDTLTRPRARRPIDTWGTLLMVALFAFALGCVTSSTWQERPEMPMVVGR